MSVALNKTMVVIPPVNSTALMAIRAAYDRGDINAVVLLGFPEHNIPDVGLVVSGMRNLYIEDQKKLNREFKNAIAILGPAVIETIISNNKYFPKGEIHNTARDKAAAYVYIEDPKRYALTEDNSFKLLTLSSVHSELQSVSKTNQINSVIGKSSEYAGVFTKSPQPGQDHNSPIPGVSPPRLGR